MAGTVPQACRCVRTYLHRSSVWYGRHMVKPKVAPVDTTYAEPQQSAWFALLFAHATVMSHLEAALSERHEISFSACEILCHLDGAEPMAVRSLASELVSVSPSRASRVIQELVDAGHVRRSAVQSDGRISLVSLTAAGRRYASSVKSTFADAAQECFVEALDESDLEALCRIWQKLEARSIDLQREKPPS